MDAIIEKERELLSHNSRVLHMGSVNTLGAVVDASRDLIVPTAADGPWFMDVRWQGPTKLQLPWGWCADEPGAYNTALTVRFVFAAPKERVDACFLGRLDHPLVHHTVARGELDSFFWDTLPKEASPALQSNGFIKEFISHANENGRRLSTIEQYRPLQKEPALFEPEWRREWTDPALLSALDGEGPEPLMGVLSEVTPGVFTFPLLSPAFCAKFSEEIDSYYASGLPVRRPNSMNNYGVIVTEIGMSPMVDALQREVLQPIARLLFPEQGGQFDSHHTFMVQYKPGEDLGLDMHTDDSDVTFNVCIGKEFTGAGLSFCGQLGHEDHRQLSHVYQHVKGACVVHLGQKRHGADDIATGERRNLIIWNHSQAYRESRAYKDMTLYQQESGPPSAECLSYTHDRDYGAFKPYPEGRTGFQGQGWCPPKEFEYEGFEEEAEPPATSGRETR
jgi:hypothetical protein